MAGCCKIILPDGRPVLTHVRAAGEAAAADSKLCQLACWFAMAATCNGELISGTGVRAALGGEGMPVAVVLPPPILVLIKGDGMVIVSVVMGA